MTCLEAQSNIMAFIEKKLPDDVIPDFVKHMRYCKNCREELEIYYTLIVGMHQVDNNQELSQNFAKDLENELNRLEWQSYFCFLYTINVWIRYIISNSG